jgi:hypothetical protein
MSTAHDTTDHHPPKHMTPEQVVKAKEATPFDPGRGREQLTRYGLAMEHELHANAYKGHWGDVGQEDLAWEIFWHALKLIAAVYLDPENRVAIKEYAADTGNCSWMLADVMKALREPSSDQPTLTKDLSFKPKLDEVEDELRAIFKKLTGKEPPAKPPPNESQ